MKENLQPEKKGFDRRSFIATTSMALAGLAFGAKTSKAEEKEIPKNIANPAGIEKDPSLPPVPEQTKAALVRFLSEAGAKISFLKTFLVVTFPVSIIEGAEGQEWVKKLESPLLIDVMQSTDAANARFVLTASRLITGLEQMPKITQGTEPDEEYIEGMPARESYIDQHGNQIIILRSTPKLEILDMMTRIFTHRTETEKSPSGWSIEEKAIIVPPMPLARNIADASKPRPFDFTIPFGNKEKIEGFLYVRPEAPLFLTHGYYVYGDKNSFGDVPETKHKYESALEEIVQGLQAVDKLFGGERKFTDSIVLMEFGKKNNHMNIENAYVEGATPKAVVVFMDILLRSQGRNDVTGFHEAVHSVDMQLGISSHTDFKRLFSRLPADFFDDLKESEFLKVPGGHPQDNELEFLASLLNSLTLPDWNKKFDSLDLYFLKNYRYSLLTLQEVIKQCGKAAIPAQARIFGILEERLTALDDAIALKTNN